jgi:hypothetical protein
MAEPHPNGPAQDWKRYPYAAPWGDPAWFTFPACDGDARRLGVQTYFVDGFLRGARTGTSYAFLTVFTDARLGGGAQRFSFYSLALFDCDRRHYGTCTDFDFPHPASTARDKLATAPDHLHLCYRSPAGDCLWRNQREPSGALRPFAWSLALHGVDHHGARMALELEVEALRPPAPLGGPELGGEMMFLGAERTFSYFQSGLRMRGRIAWGEVEEEVSGEVGWIDRQWAEDDFAKHQDPETSRYRNEWRVMQFDNGWDLSCFHQYLRDQRNAVVPWTGVSAQGPGPRFELRATHRVELEVPEFIRSPGIVRGLLMLSEGPRYFPYRYRLRVPEWEMDVSAEPFTDAPAHQFPIEWWSGPVRLEGRLFGEPVHGLGFDERSCPRVRGFEIAAALQQSADHASDRDVAAAARRMLAYRAWEVQALALRGDPGAAAMHLASRVNPLLAAAPRSGTSQRLEQLAADLATVLDEEAATASR